MSTAENTERPSWAFDTHTSGDEVIHRGLLHTWEGFTAQIVSHVIAGDVAPPALRVGFEGDGDTAVSFDVPMTRLDHLIDILCEARGDVAIRPGTGEVVGLKPRNEEERQRAEERWRALQSCAVS